MSDFKAKMHQIQFRLGLPPKSRWESLQHSSDLLAGFKGPTSKGGKGNGWRMKGWKGESRENKREGKRRGPQKLVHTLDVQNPKKYPDCRTDLIGSGGNAYVCPGRQTQSRRHCVHESNVKVRFAKVIYYNF